MKRRIVILFTLFLVATAMHAQSFFNANDFPVNGYAKKISGLDFDYHSCIPGFRQSMLLRALNGKDYMEWETDPCPVKTGKEYAAFIWIAALGSSPGKARMDLSVDDSRHTYSFYTDGQPEWTINNPDGSSLSFNSIMVDQNGDNHGYMILRIPSKELLHENPLKIRVTGSKANLTSWYMTFVKPVKTGVTMREFPAILKDGSQLVEIGVFYFGNDSKAEIFSNGKLISKPDLKFGYNTINLGLPPVNKTSKINLKVVAGDFSVKNVITLEPVKKWNIRFIQHTHTDIGYTRSQTEILAEHLRYIDYALDYCDATDNYPENARFRWTCEASWPVDEYLKCRPQSQIDRLIKRIKEGRIEITGMYFNFDELPDEKILASSLEALGRIREKGIPVKLAMQDDVNGIGWCMNDYFGNMGVKYLNMGTHGHRALICFDKPTMFWWESPSGKRMLTFRAEHYMTGNTVLEMQTGDFDKFKRNLMNYLTGLEAKNYPYDEMAIQHSGYLTDNSPPSTTMSDLVKKWDEMFEWPKISTSLAETFFTDMEKAHGNEFPVIRGAWPDWWTDGFGASARESATTRLASSSLTANEAGLSMASLSGIRLPAGINSSISLANNALLFYTEHTVGYSESVREPLCQSTMEQRALKESYAWEANRRVAGIGEETMGLLQSMFKREALPTLVVFNTLSWKKSGVATVYIDHQIVPLGKTAGIFDHEGNRLPVQAIQSRSDVTQWAVWLNDIPAFGYKKFTVKAIDDVSQKTSTDNGMVENKWYKIVTDKSKGTISSWFDKDLSLEMTEPSGKYEMGEFIHEELGNRSQMESHRLNDYKRSPLDTVWFDSMQKGEIWNSIRFYGESSTFEKPRGYMIEVRLFNTTKRVDIACSVIKKSIVSPESFYIAFPFNLKDGKHFTEVQGGIIETGKDQIKGSSNDWYTVQSFSSVRNSQAQIVIGSAEMPLMQFGAINTGRYVAGATPQSTNLFSWPMNNYWVTNFNADQRGGHSWTYYLTSSDDVSNAFASGFGWSCRIPYLTRIIPGSGTGDNNWEGSFISGWPSNVLLVNSGIADDGKSCILHLRETNGQKATLGLRLSDGMKVDLTEVDATGKPVSSTTPEIGPYESRFYKILIE
jgi:alpha-mannosidase